MSQPIVVRDTLCMTCDGRAEVWQSTDPRFSTGILVGAVRMWPFDYRQVYLVESTDLEEIFFLTNQQEDGRVESLVEDVRSTSIDDIVILPDGTVFWLGLDGWEELQV